MLEWSSQTISFRLGNDPTNRARLSRDRARLVHDRTASIWIPVRSSVSLILSHPNDNETKYVN